MQGHERVRVNKRTEWRHCL